MFKLIIWKLLYLLVKIETFVEYLSFRNVFLLATLTVRLVYIVSGAPKEAIRSIQTN